MRTMIATAVLAVALAGCAGTGGTGTDGTPQPHAHPWSEVTGVPTGFADGQDNDTTYTAGPGLTLTGTELALDQGVAQGLARAACYDSPEELAAAVPAWDQNASDDLTTTTSFGGALSGVYGALAIRPGAVDSAAIAASTPFVSVRDGAGTEQFAVTRGAPGLQIATTGPLTISFDPANQRVSIGSLVSHAWYRSTAPVEVLGTCGNLSGIALSVTAPVAGVVFVTFEANVNVYHSNTHAGTDQLVIDVSQSAECTDDATGNTSYYELPGGLAAEYLGTSVAGVRRFAVAPGANTFTMTAYRTFGSGADTNHRAWIHRANLQAVFYPN